MIVLGPSSPDLNDQTQLILEDERPMARDLTGAKLARKRVISRSEPLRSAPGATSGYKEINQLPLRRPLPRLGSGVRIPSPAPNNNGLDGLAVAGQPRREAGGKQRRTLGTAQRKPNARRKLPLASDAFAGPVSLVSSNRGSDEIGCRQCVSVLGAAPRSTIRPSPKPQPTARFGASNAPPACQASG